LRPTRDNTICKAAEGGRDLPALATVLMPWHSDAAS